jgi:predicted DNA-binding WGR domain protein
MLFPSSSFLEKHVPYLVLQNFQPSENKFRIYIIQLEEKDGKFIVELSWGRIARTPQHKQQIFEEKRQFFSFLKSNIATRRRHGYRLVDMSLDFPLFSNLIEMN